MGASLRNLIGIPYETHGRGWSGVDCWGLVALYYREILGKRIPSYREEYADAGDRDSVGLAVARHRDSWLAAPEPARHDVLLFRVMGVPMHCGVYLGDNDFIHAFKGCNSSVERLNSITWARRHVGSYRWRGN